jgi:DNA-binding response OmpR family regulator
MQPRVLVVEDDNQIASLLTFELGRLGFSVRAVATARDAFDAVSSWRPAMMLLDLGLPDRDGQDVLRELRERGNTLPVICVTARDQQMDRVGGLRAGADDYIVKPFDLAELDARMRAVLRRTGGAPVQDVVVGGLRLLPDGLQVLVQGEPLALTPRELHVLRRMLRNVGRVVTKQQLTETLAALNEDIGDKTIEVYVHRLRAKLHGSGVEIVTVRGFGYMLRAMRTSPAPAA